MVRYRTKLSQNRSLSWNQKITTAAELFFLVQILRDLFNLKDQIKRTNLAL
jgi:hypothetical protein